MSGKIRQSWTDGFGRLIEVDERTRQAGVSHPVLLLAPATATTEQQFDRSHAGIATRSFSYDMISRLTVNRYRTTKLFLHEHRVARCAAGICLRVQATDARSKTTTYAYDAPIVCPLVLFDTTPGVAYDMTALLQADALLPP